MIEAGAGHSAAWQAAEDARRAEMAQLVAMLREMVGNPFEAK